MFHILGFLFFFILIILVIGLALISKVIRTILGIGRRMTTGNASSSTNTSSRNSQYNSHHLPAKAIHSVSPMKLHRAGKRYLEVTRVNILTLKR